MRFSEGQIVGILKENEAGFKVRETNPHARIVALEPSTSAVISGVEAGTHHVEEIGIGFIPPLLDQSLYDKVRSIDEDEA